MKQTKNKFINSSGQCPFCEVGIPLTKVQTVLSDWNPKNFGYVNKLKTKEVNHENKR